MTRHDNYRQNNAAVEELVKRWIGSHPGGDLIPVNQAMGEEKARYLQAMVYERTEKRKGYANGYKPKTAKTWMGEITFPVPQVREGRFDPTKLKKGLRSEKALAIKMAEIAMQDISPKVEFRCLKGENSESSRPGMSAATFY